jgi:tetratricopeptide (TPR) repeat protein
VITQQPHQQTTAYETLEVLEHRLSCETPGPDLLHAYFEQVVSCGEIDRGRRVMTGLKKKQPGNRQVLSIYIALCLKADDHHAAMTAIEDFVGSSTPDDGLIDAALAVRNSIGKKTISEARPSKTTLSLCMIARNEQAGLGACLNTVKSMVDEIIVIDTGSSDRTRDVARIYGAHTFEFQWRDDFSAARNLSLEKAGGDWILILDADEVIAPEDQPRIRHLIDRYQQQPTAFSIVTRNYTHLANAVGWQPNGGDYPKCEAGIGWFPSPKIRLFPRRETIRFRFPVHEMVDPSVREAGLPIASCDVCIHHYGHLNEARNLKKAKTYFQLGYTKLDQLGDDAAAIRELAVQAGQLEYWPESLSLWRKLLHIHPDFSEAYVNMAGACWQTAQYEQALEYARKAATLAPEQKEAHFNIAVSLLLMGRAADAAGLLQELVRKHNGYLAAVFMLAAACSCAGDHTRGRALFQALSRTPVGKALDVAEKDLEQRMNNAGLEDYARHLRHSFENAHSS